MAKFWESKEFKDLNKEWKQKLADSEFKDIEDDKERLDVKNDRTQNITNFEQTLEYFSAFNEYLNTQKAISERDRKILELYVDGVFVTGKNGIVEQTGWSDRTVRSIIYKHKEQIIKR